MGCRRHQTRLAVYSPATTAALAQEANLASQQGDSVVTTSGPPADFVDASVGTVRESERECQGVRTHGLDKTAHAGPALCWKTSES
jgi:hypothetical protein